MGLLPLMFLIIRRSWLMAFAMFHSHSFTYYAVVALADPYGMLVHSMEVHGILLCLWNCLWDHCYFLIIVIVRVQHISAQGLPPVFKGFLFLLQFCFLASIDFITMPRSALISNAACSIFPCQILVAAAVICTLHYFLFPCRVTADLRFSSFLSSIMKGTLLLIWLSKLSRSIFQPISVWSTDVVK